LDIPERRQLTILVKKPAYAFSREVTKIPGIKIVGMGYGGEVDCADYTLNYVKREEWDNDDIKQLPNNPVETLAKHGYQPVDIPKRGDIVAYGGFHGRNLQTPFIRHVGTYLEDGRIMSKFGSADVYEHPWYLTPSNFGNTIFFFRKEVRFGILH
jgi:hypothetical protein